MLTYVYRSTIVANQVLEKLIKGKVGWVAEHGCIEGLGLP
jgi:hypothetical protein